MYPSNLLDISLLLSGIEVGVHYYWDIAGISLHGEVFIISWLVIFLILGWKIQNNTLVIWQKMRQIKVIGI